MLLPQHFTPGPQFRGRPRSRPWAPQPTAPRPWKPQHLKGPAPPAGGPCWWRCAEASSHPGRIYFQITWKGGLGGLEDDFQRISWWWFYVLCTSTGRFHAVFNYHHCNGRSDLSAEHLHRSCSNPLWQTTSAAGHPNVPHRQPTSLRFVQGPSKHGHEMKGSGWIKIVSGSQSLDLGSGWWICGPHDPDLPVHLTRYPKKSQNGMLRSMLTMPTSRTSKYEENI